MKKNYLSPAIETIVLGFSIMQDAPISGMDPDKDKLDNFFGAPKRKPF